MEEREVTAAMESRSGHEDKTVRRQEVRRRTRMTRSRGSQAVKGAEQGGPR